MKRCPAAHAKALAALTYEIRAGDESIVISGSQLPIATDGEDMILRALNLKTHWPKNNGTRALDTAILLNLESLRVTLASLTGSLNREAVNATATYEDGTFTYTEAQDGRQLDLQALAVGVADLAREGLGGTVEAAFTPIPATYTEDMAKVDTVLISEFSTSFSGSTYGKANRVFNIQKAASLIDGVTLEPGEEFDMNATIGDRNEKNGWKMAAAILDGTYVQEYGGGVCQVSTTLYNAVLLADLEVTERNHHSWPLGYVDVGRDATISTGGPNFKFVNSTDTPITVSAGADTKKKTITVRIYGRHSQDWASIKVYSKKTSTLDDLGYEIVVDETLAPGETLEVRESRRGCTADTYRKFLRRGRQPLGNRTGDQGQIPLHPGHPQRKHQLRGSRYAIRERRFRKEPPFFMQILFCCITAMPERTVSSIPPGVHPGALPAFPSAAWKSPPSQPPRKPGSPPRFPSGPPGPAHAAPPASPGR